MSVASSIVSVLLALALAGTRVGKLRRFGAAVQQVEAVGVTGRAIAPVFPFGDSILTARVPFEGPWQPPASSGSKEGR